MAWEATAVKGRVEDAIGKYMANRCNMSLKQLVEAFAADATAAADFGHKFQKIAEDVVRSLRVSAVDEASTCKFLKLAVTNNWHPDACAFSKLAAVVHELLAASHSVTVDSGKSGPDERRGRMKTLLTACGQARSVLSAKNTCADPDAHHNYSRAVGETNKLLEECAATAVGHADDFVGAAMAALRTETDLLEQIAAGGGGPKGHRGLQRSPRRSTSFLGLRGR